MLVEYRKLQWKPEGTGVWRYKCLLPFRGEHVTLDEGHTPIIRSTVHPYKKLYFKFEGDNPTGSFKDRGTTVVISHAKSLDSNIVAVASTGNMGASVSAYAAHAGLRAKVFVPADAPEGKLAQIIAYGATLVRVNGSFQDCIEELWAEVHKGAYMAMTGFNPFYLEGEKTLAFELYEEMGVPDKIFVPVGTGGLTTAIWKGFKELRELGVTKKLPQMVCVQGEGCSPIIDAWKEGHEEPKHIRVAHSVASAILVKTPINGHTAIRAMKESKGFGIEVTDRQILDAIKDLGKEGVFAEPAAAATLAALKKSDVPKDEKIALMVTGHGLKEPGAVLRR